MNTSPNILTNSKEIKRILQDKHILWVDDRWEQIEPFIDELVDKEYLAEAQMQVAFDLSSALEYVENKENPLDMVMIDLNISSMPEELQTLRKQYFQTDMLNHGQSLGVWLSQHRPEIKYVYLSAFVEHFDTQAHSSQENALIIGKNFKVANFPGWLAGVLANLSAH